MDLVTHVASERCIQCVVVEANSMELAVVEQIFIVGKYQMRFGKILD